MTELSVAEQRYLAVLAVIAEGHPVSSVASQCDVSRQRCMPGWRAMSLRG